MSGTSLENQSVGETEDKTVKPKQTEVPNSDERKEDIYLKK